MNRTISILLLSIFALLINGCGDKTIDSQWTDQQISVDGVASDWQNFRLQSYDRQDLYMGVTNDEDNLYILISFKSQNLSRRFYMNGLTVWFEAEGKEKKEIGLRLVPEMNMRMRSPENMPEDMSKKLEERRRDLINGLTVTSNGGDFYKLDSGGNVPRGAYTIENGAVNIELAIPLTGNNITPFAVGSLPGSKMRAGFEIGDSQDDMERLNMTGTMGSRPVGGRGGRGGIGGRGAMPGGPIGRQPQSLQFQELWLNINLADENEGK